MAKPVKDAKLKAQQIWPGATVFARGKGSIKHRHPVDNGRFMIDTQVGGRGWHFGDGPFTEANEVDTAWIDAHPIDDAPWQKKMVLADYNAYAFREPTLGFDQGQLIEYRHPASGESVAFQPTQLQWTNDLDQISSIADPQAVSATINDDMLTWADAYGTGIDFQWQTQTARMAKFVKVNSLAELSSPPQFIIDGGNPLLRVELLFQKSSGVEIWVDGVEWDEKANNPQETLNHVEFRVAGEILWYFRKPKAWDSNRQPIYPSMRLRKSGANLFVEILTPWSWLETATFPVTVDVTIDDQVAGDDYDAEERSDGLLFDAAAGDIDFKSAADAELGNAYTGGAIFTVDGPASGDTIDVATFSVNIDHVARDFIDCEVSCEDVDDAADFSATPDIIDRTRTGNTTSWVDLDAGAGWQVSPSIVDSVADVITDRAGWASGQDLCVIFAGHLNANGGNCEAYDYGASSANAPKLHIEYTAGGGVSIEVPTGSLEIIGYAPVVTVTAHISIEVPPGVLEITGYAPVVTTSDHQSVEIPVGALEITGYAPTVTTTAHVSIEIPAGGLEVDGYAPTVTTTGHISIEVPAGGLEVTGYAPVITTTGHISITIPVGGIRITGYVPVVTVSGSISIEIPTGILEITGYAPTVTGDIVSGVDLTLWERSTSLTLEPRSNELTLRDRSTALTLEDR